VTLPQAGLAVGFSAMLTLRRCDHCAQFFKQEELTCPHCGKARSVASGRAALALAVAAATLLAGNCGSYQPRPLYGVVIFDGGSDGG